MQAVISIENDELPVHARKLGSSTSNCLPWEFAEVCGMRPLDSACESRERATVILARRIDVETPLWLPSGSALEVPRSTERRGDSRAISCVVRPGVSRPIGLTNGSTGVRSP